MEAIGHGLLYKSIPQSAIQACAAFFVWTLNYRDTHLAQSGPDVTELGPVAETPLRTRGNPADSNSDGFIVLIHVFGFPVKDDLSPHLFPLLSFTLTINRVSARRSVPIIAIGSHSSTTIFGPKKTPEFVRQ